jgi:hypothetical protein
LIVFIFPTLRICTNAMVSNLPLIGGCDGYVVDVVRRIEGSIRQPRWISPVQQSPTHGIPRHDLLADAALRGSPEAVRRRWLSSLALKRYRNLRLAPFVDDKLRAIGCPSEDRVALVPGEGFAPVGRRGGAQNVLVVVPQVEDDQRVTDKD